MPYVTVDVDLDDIDTDDLCEEICRRLRRNYTNRQNLSEKQKTDLRLTIIDLNEALALTPEAIIEIKTLDDRMKYDHFAEVFKKYTSKEIETLLP